MTHHAPLIALLTDFGLADAYVGTMKGVMLSICPSARLVDLTHHITPQDVRAGAYVLSTAFRHFPPHTIFLIVVDPGVGTARQPVAVETAHGICATRSRSPSRATACPASAGPFTGATFSLRRRPISRPVCRSTSWVPPCRN